MKHSLPNPIAPLWLLALALEGAAAALAWQGHGTGDAQLPAALAAHAGAACALFAPSFFLRRLRRRTRYALRLCSLFTLALPPVGILGSGCAVFASRHVFRRKGLVRGFEQRRLKIWDREDFRNAEEIVQDEMDVAPLVDLITDPDAETRRRAVITLRDMGTEASVKLLHRCLSDSDAEVRFYAHGALDKIQERFDAALSRARARAAGGSVPELLELSRICLRYARTGLPEEGMRQSLFTEALACLNECAAIDPSPRLRLRMAEAGILAGQPDMARAILTDLCADPILEAEARLSLCGLAFERCDMDDLRLHVTALRLAAPPSTEDKSLLRRYYFWASPEAPHAA